MSAKTKVLVSAWAGLFVGSLPRSATGADCEPFQVWAPPGGTWGVWVTVGTHIGSIDYCLDVKARGATLVLGQARFFNRAGAATRMW